MIELRVNGETRRFDGDPSTPLLWYLRDELELTGTKFGCGIAQCGACTVHLNGDAIFSCVTPVSAAEGQEITTIEGLSDDLSHPLQKAWIEEKAGHLHVVGIHPLTQGRRAVLRPQGSIRKVIAVGGDSPLS